MDKAVKLIPDTENPRLFDDAPEIVETTSEQGLRILTGEFWTARQRQANALHELAYRACFKGQLPRYFITRFTGVGDLVYDPFSGRGTTCLEAALNGRNIIANDVNPISKILLEGRLEVPELTKIERRLSQIRISTDLEPEIDLSMFFEERTCSEIVSLKNYFLERSKTGKLDSIDKWIRAVATNRLTGHSSGYFSVYTLPPNQAVSPERQIRINEKRNQKPDYRDTKALILKKSASLQKDLTEQLRANLRAAKKLFITGDARETRSIPSDSVALTVTSPPFLDVVQYAADNWLRCWFNGIDVNAVASSITMAKKIDDWNNVMSGVFNELYRITKPGGYVAFEVGEVRNGTIRLEEHVAPIGTCAGFNCSAIIINEQQFTKTANIWGVSNNTKGTNSNRIVLFEKAK